MKPAVILGGGEQADRRILRSAPRTVQPSSRPAVQLGPAWCRPAAQMLAAEHDDGNAMPERAAKSLIDPSSVPADPVEKD